jgi:hypothetical protein
MRPKAIKIMVVVCLGGLACTGPVSASILSTDDLAVFSADRVDLHWKAKVHGHVGALDDIQLHSKAKVFGDLYAGDRAKLGWRASAGEVHDKLGLDAFGPGPAWQLAASDQPDIRVDNKDLLMLTPGTYGDLDVAWKGHLVLSAGTYRFDSIALDTKSKITLDASGGDVTILSAGTTRFDWRSRVLREGDGKALIASIGNVTLDEASVDASVASGGSIQLGWKSHVAGQAHARGRVNIQSQASVGGAYMGSVPEPTSAAMLAVAGLALLRRRGKA